MRRGLATFQYLGHAALIYFCWLFTETVPPQSVTAELKKYTFTACESRTWLCTLNFAEVFQYLNPSGACVAPGTDQSAGFNQGTVISQCSQASFCCLGEPGCANLYRVLCRHLPLEPGWVRPCCPRGSRGLWRCCVSLLTPAPSLVLPQVQPALCCLLP